MNEVLIRKANIEDLSNIVDITINSWRESYKNIIAQDFLNNLNKEVMLEGNINNFDKSNTIVAIKNNEIVGFCRYTINSNLDPDIINCDSEIIALYVNPNLKRQGIGSKLFNYIKEELISNTKKSLIIWCLKENYNSRLFYEKMGGKIVKEKDIIFGNEKYMEVGFKYIFD